MEQKENLKITQSKRKDGESKSLLNLGPDTYTEKQSKPKHPQGTKTVQAQTFEVNMEIQIRKGKKEIKPPEKMVVTTEQVIDTNEQIFHAGVATILQGDGSLEEPTEMTMGVDAQDVRAILRLLGMAK